MSVLVHFSGVTLGYGYRVVLRGVDFRVERDRCYVVEGPNGCGKTTLLRAVAGFLRPRRGAGHWRLPPGRIGWLTHDASMYMEWTAKTLYRWYRNMFFPNAGAEASAWTEDPVLGRFRDEPLRAFSRGMRQRFFLHLLNAWQPDLVCLDEPLTGLDQAARRWCVSLLKTWRRRGQTLVITTHHPLEDLPHTRVRIHNGRILPDGA